ncbi:MAG: glycosyltransferase [Bacteroidales bacterium]|nr:glycosyltransferase [Bacteroidales bacterium]
MNIISIGPAYPLRGGIADFNERFARELLSLGHSVSIVSYSLQYPNILFPGKTQYAEKEQSHTIPIHRFINSINPFSWIHTAQYIKKEKPDIVFIHYWMPFFAPALGMIAKHIGKKTRSHIVGICHNFVSHEPKPGEKLLNSFFIQQCTSAVAMSQTVAQDIQNAAPKLKITVTPHPLYDNFGKKIEKDAACKTLGLNANTSYILFFGLIRAYKGLDLLLESLAQMHSKNVKLIIAGEFYDSEQKYHDIIQQHTLEEQVIIHNSFIPEKNVRLYFSAADIVAQTYHTATQSGITQIAYHFEKPMLVTNVGGLSEIVPHNKVGYVCEKDPKEIAEALDDFFTEKKETKFISNIQERKHMFSWEYFCKTIFNNLKI